MPRRLAPRRKSGSRTLARLSAAQLFLRGTNGSDPCDVGGRLGFWVDNEYLLQIFASSAPKGILTFFLFQPCDEDAGVPVS